LLYPTANATDIVATQPFSWTAVPGAEGYVLHVGTSPGAWDIVSAGTAGTAYLVTRPLPTDRVLYAQVVTRLAGVWRYAVPVPFRMVNANASQ
jgi:hypothetical protein